MISMEQKQLDELDETPLEEYIEEEDEVEDFKAKKKAMKKPKKSPWKEESSEQAESTSDSNEEDTTATSQELSSASAQHSNESGSETKTSEPFMTKKGWMIVSILLFLLLIMAIFTGGFGMIGKKQISQSEAEAKVLAYVNTELLQGDTKATILTSADAGEHYKITLAVAGETVDTYLTKDGQMFFPQGFALANITTSTPTAIEQSENANPTPAANIPVSTTPAEPVTSTKPARTIELNLAAKKWVFTPTLMNAKAGDHIKLTITPTALDFTFAIPELNIEKNITKTSVIEFDVPTAGTYTFTCSSCEDYRGMTGKINVE